MNDEIAVLMNRLRMRRKSLRLTQADVASKCGLLQANYSRMESGRQVPSLETLVSVADALQMRLRLEEYAKTIYHVMYKNEPVADVELSRDRKNIKFRKLVPDGLKQPFCGDKLDLDRFYRFLKSRCYEDGRGDLSEILKKAHLPDNNPYTWIRITHGVTFEDFFWILIDDEKLCWEDVRVR